jgi:phosphonate metabolism protein (transferase hexapeptide repeat family)
MLGDHTQLDRGCHVVHSRVGDYTYASLGVTLQRAEIGRFGSIAAYVMIGATNHPMDRVTTHPFTYAPQFGNLRTGEDSAVAAAVAAGAVVVGHDVWIGGHAIVMPGVTIGHGAVVGAHSLVRTDVDPYTVVAGVPARPLRQRFDHRTVEQLLRIHWWDWDRETLRRRLDDFADVRLFVEKYGAE